jgi:hypothetical protein
MRLEITAKLGGAAELDAAQFDTPPVNLFRTLRTPAEIAKQVRPFRTPFALFPSTTRRCVGVCAHADAIEDPTASRIAPATFECATCFLLEHAWSSYTALHSLSHL